MKLFAFLLSFYILSLNFIPCGDKLECSAMEEQLQSILQSEQHEHQSEICTPFCSCSCCALSIISQPLPIAKSPGLPFHHWLQFAHPDYNALDLHAVWQPPRNLV
ncbi:MAG: DUF6660 family protein [Ferruginibacter sp.]